MKTILECAGFDADFERDFPTLEGRYLFYKEYVLACCACRFSQPSNSIGAETSLLETTVVHIGSILLKEQFQQNLSHREQSELDSFLRGFDDAVTKYTLASHLFWGSWSIVQASNSRIQFDFLPYSLRRAKGYQLHKKLFFDVN